MYITDRELLELIAHNIMQIEMIGVRSSDKNFTEQLQDELTIRAVSMMHAISPLFDQMKTISNTVKKTVEVYERILDKSLPMWRELNKQLKNLPVETFINSGE